MFANRYTALVDACSLAGTLRRNLLLSLAEAEFFRLRWSQEILDETEKAIAKILAKKSFADAAEAAHRNRCIMERAFPEAMVDDYERFNSVVNLPDPKDDHVVAAALKTRASTIITENIRDFPEAELKSCNIEVRTADEFIADTVELEPQNAVSVIRRMRQNLKRPEKTAEDLLRDMEAEGLLATAAVLLGYVASL